MVSEAEAPLRASHGTSLTHKPTNRLRTKLIKPEGSVDEMEQSAVIDKINRTNCQANDVGETGKNYVTWLREQSMLTVDPNDDG